MEDAVMSTNSLFYKYYIVDTYARRQKNEADTLFNLLNCDDGNMKVTFC